MEKKIFIVMGPPGCGKGTQSKKISEKFDVAHISTGDLFRKAISEETELGLKAKNYMDKGEYVPDDVTIGMLKERISMSDCDNGFILDGFPRTIPQAEALNEMLKDEKITVVYYNVSDEITVGRIKKRAREDQEAGKDVRADDLNEDTIKSRLESYHSKTDPVLDYYRQKGMLLELDASRTVEEIFDEFISKIE